MAGWNELSVAFRLYPLLLGQPHPVVGAVLGALTPEAVSANAELARHLRNDGFVPLAVLAGSLARCADEHCDGRGGGAQGCPGHYDAGDLLEALPFLRASTAMVVSDSGGVRPAAPLPQAALQPKGCERCVVVEGFPPGATRQWFRETFSKAGKVRDVRLHDAGAAASAGQRGAEPQKADDLYMRDIVASSGAGRRRGGKGAAKGRRARGASRSAVATPFAVVEMASKAAAAQAVDKLHEGDRDWRGGLRVLRPLVAAAAPPADAGAKAAAQRAEAGGAQGAQKAALRGEVASLPSGSDVDGTLKPAGAANQGTGVVRFVAADVTLGGSTGVYGREPPPLAVGDEVSYRLAPGSGGKRRAVDVVRTALGSSQRRKRWTQSGRGAGRGKAAHAAAAAAPDSGGFTMAVGPDGSRGFGAGRGKRIA